MLILLGGAPRAGKGIISRRVAAEAEYPLLSLDPLKMGPQNAVPSLGIDADANPAEVGERWGRGGGEVRERCAADITWGSA